MSSPHTRSDFDHSPMIAFYEMTRACDLACVHCRADAQRTCDPDELPAALARGLVDELLRFPMPPLLVLTGGDPLKRADAFDLVSYAVSQGLKVAMTPSATPLVTREAVQRLRASGLHRLAISLDAADASTHDAFRQVPGSFRRTIEIADYARQVDLPLQINTTLGLHNVEQLEAMAALVGEMGAVLWSVFFIVPTGRGTAEQRLDATATEQAFARLWRLSSERRVPIKTTEAPHYRRFVLQQQVQQRRQQAAPRRGALPPGHLGTNDGKGILFISHTGEIFPSGFLPVCCGRYPLDSLVRVYQDAALFRALRDPNRLGGKCGVCEYRQICGGSRARAFAMAGDPLAAEPDCEYIPPRHSTSALPESVHA